MAHPEFQSGSHVSVASGVVLMLSPAPELHSWLPNLLGAKRQNHLGTVSKIDLRLVCSTRAKTCLNGHIKKISSDNEDIPHDGRRQNRSAVYQTPVSFGQLQPGTVLSFCR